MRLERWDVPRFDPVLALLEERLTDLEVRMKALRQENESLRTALARASAGSAEPDGDHPGTRALRMASLEAEREDVRGRLQTLLDAL